jgi:hypothetical protein
MSSAANNMMADQQTKNPSVEGFFIESISGLIMTYYITVDNIHPPSGYCQTDSEHPSCHS